MLMRILKHGPIVAFYTTHTFLKIFKNATTPKDINFPNISMLEQVRSLGSHSLYPKLAKVPLSSVDSQCTTGNIPRRPLQKRHLKSACFCTASKFIALISRRSFRQILANF